MWGAAKYLTAIGRCHCCDHIGVDDNLLACEARCADSDDGHEDCETSVLVGDGVTAYLRTEPAAPHADPRTLRPSLSELERDFHAFATHKKGLSAGQLSDLWKCRAHRRKGTLSTSEARLIEHSALALHPVIDLDKSGTVSYTEFVVFMLGGLEERAQLKDMRGKLQNMVKRHPRSLEMLVKQFQVWDKDGDGYVTTADVTQHLAELHCKPYTQGRLNREEEAAYEFLVDPDADPHGRVDLWELLAFALGERKMPVELLLYDISDGASRHLSPLLFGRSFEAIYHCSILAYGREYWYGGRVLNGEPATTPFGTPLAASELNLQPSAYWPDLQVIPLGYSFVSPSELTGYLAETMAPKYTPDSYDVVTRNCICFCEELARFLTGAGIPERVLRLPELVMDTPVGQMLGGPQVLRPLLNRWLGGARQSAEEFAGGDGAPAAEAIRPRRGACRSPVFARPARLGKGTCIIADGACAAGSTTPSECTYLVGLVTEEDDEFVELLYFAPLYSEFSRQAVSRRTVTEQIVGNTRRLFVPL